MNNKTNINIDVINKKNRITGKLNFVLLSFTKNLYYNEYPNGPEVLEESIKGGELFQTFVNNPVSIFMTHMPNYAFDRLAPYTFESVLSLFSLPT